MLSLHVYPLSVMSIEIRDVKCVEDTLTLGSEGQLFLVGLPRQSGVQSCDHRDATRTKSRNKIAIHRVFVDVYLDLTHAAGSAPVLLLKSLGLLRLGFQV